MAAPAGNQFWKLRATHGRKPLFTNAHLLWEAACEYFEHCEENPLIEIDFRGKDATKVQLPHPRPFTIHGLCTYLGVNVTWWRQFKSSLAVKAEKPVMFPDGTPLPEDLQVDDFSSVISRIEEIMYDQKFSGAATGFFNPMIIARDLSLKEQTENTQTIVVPDVSEEDRKKFREQFNRDH